jgi:hypothetical protein
MTQIDVRAFDQYEAAGWGLVAAVYERVWSPVTSQVVDSLLDAAGIEANCASWTLEPERAMLPGGRASAERKQRASMSRPPWSRSQHDATRLRRSSRRPSRTFRSPTSRSMRQLGTSSPSEIPPGPTFFQYANDYTFRSLLRTAGFVQVSVDITTIEFPLDSADDLITALADGTVRTGALLRAADEAQRQVVRESLEARLDQCRRGDGYAVPAPVKIASGRKPD